MTGGAAVTAVGMGGALAANAFAGEEPRPQAEDRYLLTSETTEGPYYIDADKLRRDVTEDKPGIPLLLRIKVIDNETCRPVRDAAVDIWHCAARVRHVRGHLAVATGMREGARGPSGPGRLPCVGSRVTG